MSSHSQVVVTGMGVVSPLGVGCGAFWEGLSAGKSGVDWITSFEVVGNEVRFAGQVQDFDASRHLSKPAPNRRDRTLQMSLVAAAEALRQARLIDDAQDPVCDFPVGVVVGSGHGPCFEVEHGYAVFHEQGPRGVSPMTVPRCMFNSLASQLSIVFRLRGANHVIASACSSASCAIGQGYMLIKHGAERAVLCGGADAPLCRTMFHAWSKLRILARHDDPTRASRPFDADRTGIVLAEGAGMVVLESAQSARERGVEPLAVVQGYGASSDAHHITAPRQDGIILAMRRCLDDAGMRPEDVNYINAHGTGTPLNDQVEAQAVAALFGPRGADMPISSIKSGLGHSLGASGALAVIACIESIRHGFVPPTLNCDTPSPEVGLDDVPRQGRSHRVHAAISNSFAFGGSNAVLLLKEFD